MTQNTHLIFDGEKIVLSPNLVPIFNFLVEIEKEIEGLLGTKEKLESIREQVLELMSLFEEVSKHCDTSKIDLNKFLSEHPETLSEKLEDVQTVRSEMIVLFAHLETLMCINFAYQKNTNSEVVIRKTLMDKKEVKKYFNKYLLNVKNEYYKENQDRFKHVTSRNVRELRNSLTHFFSVKGFALAPTEMDEKARKLEKVLNNRVTFISPKELHLLIRSAAKLMLIEWNNLTIRDNEEFKERILKVIDVIEREGAIIVKDEDLQI